MTDHPDIEAVARVICVELAKEGSLGPWDINAARAAIECLLRRWVAEYDPSDQTAFDLKEKAREMGIEL